MRLNLTNNTLYILRLTDVWVLVTKFRRHFYAEGLGRKLTLITNDEHEKIQPNLFKMGESWRSFFKDWNMIVTLLADYSYKLNRQEVKHSLILLQESGFLGTM